MSYKLSKHPQPGIKSFFCRTVAAQTHLAALFAAIVGTVLLVDKCLHLTSPNHVVAAAIFGVTSVFLFAVSSVYHFLYDGFQMSKSLEARFEKLDHIAIYLFIAGTYTSVLMNAVSSLWANFLLAFIWIVATLGILYTLFKHNLPKWMQHRYVYTGLFVLMGWTFIMRLNEILHTLSKSSIQYLFWGGICYSLGAVIYAVRRPNLIKDIFGFHEIWHICVVCGYGFHYALISGFY